MTKAQGKTRKRASIFWGKKKSTPRWDGPEQVFTRLISNLSFDVFVRLLHVWVSWCNGPKSCLDAKVCYWHSHSRAVYMAQCCQSIQLPPDSPPWKPSLRKTEQKKRQHYFLQKLTSRLNQGALNQYYKSRRCCQSVSDVCQVQVHVCVQLTSPSSKSGFRSSAISSGRPEPERLKWPFCPRSGEGGDRTPARSPARPLSRRLTGVIRSRAMWRGCLIGIATGEIKVLVGWRGRVTSAGPHGQNNKPQQRWRQYSFHYPLKDQTRYQTLSDLTEGGEQTFFFLFLNAVYTWAVPQTAITTCMKPVQSALPDQFFWLRAGVEMFRIRGRQRLHISHRHLSLSLSHKTHDNFYSLSVEAT